MLLEVVLLWFQNYSILSVCRKHSFIARYQCLSNLFCIRFRIAQSSRIPIKVLHLVRDPRAVALSRLVMHHGLGNATHEMLPNCAFDARNVEDFRNMRDKAGSYWSDGNYMTIRCVPVCIDA